ncbi:MAG: NAD(P)/FAD-dependent oxidoreductase [Alphaproteobacteria bacterium]|nr:NAD(P)/FAD-dependent oxidoreductase [Alphaproteobacteria bacterium]
MSRRVELAIVGAGPAGLAAATLAAELGLETLVLDEQAVPGGQIYRNVEGVAANRPADLDLLGPDYARGLEIVWDFRGSGAEYLPESAVFEVKAGGGIGIVRRGAAELIRADQVLIAAGAMERPVPIPGWTLPGVMTAGAAQTLLKASDLVPEGPTVIAGSGPLVPLVAVQLARAGVELRAVLQTTPRARIAAGLPQLARNLTNGELWKGVVWLRELKRTGIPLIEVDGVAAEGEGRLAAVRYRAKGVEKTIPAETLLLHEGVVPNLQLSRAAGCGHRWDDRQRCWRPETDAFGETGVEGLAVAGDCAGIGGAVAAGHLGCLAALGAAARQGRIETAERDRRADAERRALRRAMAIRPLLDRLFRPADAMVVPDDDTTVVCRCEEVTVAEIRAVAGLGAPGPNQAKAFTRAGMGPCQGRMCGLTVAELMARAHGTTPAAIGHYRIRPPVKPVTVGEWAAMAGLATPPPEADGLPEAHAAATGRYADSE